MKNRFEVLDEIQLKGIEFADKGATIFRDKETGVLYISLYMGGCTPLIDKDGKPLTLASNNKSVICSECGFEVPRNMHICPECGYMVK